MKRSRFGGLRFKRGVTPLFLFAIAFVQACLYPSPAVKDVITIKQNDFTLVLPAGFDSIHIPEGNELSHIRIELGKKLFFDNVMSLDSTVSCASCHLPDKYFTDGLPRSKGIRGEIVDRNSPSLFNVAYHPVLLREGGVPTLEMQILVPIQEHKEFDFNIVALAERLRNDAAYVQLARKAYDREIDPFVITRSISAYERTLFSGNSSYDQYFFQGKKKAMSKEALRGYMLFNSDRLHCSKCHSGFNFTNYSIVCNGVYKSYKDNGAFRLTEDEKDKGCFKVPSLRNVTETGPYMHNGSMTTLDQVIDHYAAGGKGHPNQSQLIRGFELNQKERNELKAFLAALTDESVSQD